MFKSAIILILFFSLVFFIYLSQVGFLSPRNHVHLRVMNTTNCDLNSVTVITSEMDIVISKEKLKKSPVVNGHEAQLTLHASTDIKFEYRIKASFNKCSSVMSDLRKIEGGWLMYEWVNENGVESELRSHM